MTIGNGHHRAENQFEKRSPEEIQRELDATRREMASTIHAIEEELSSRQLMLRAMEYFKGGPLRFTENLTDACVRNPIPVALIGAGLLMLSRSDARDRRIQVQDDYDGDKGRIGEKVSHATERAKEAMVHTKERAYELRGKAHDLRLRSGQRVRRSIGTAQRAWHENPMLVGLFAVAAGAALAAAIPTTKRERELIGPRRDRLMSEVKRAAQEAVETTKHELDTVKIEDEGRAIDEPLTSDLVAETYPDR